MDSEYVLASQRYAAFADRVLAPAVFTDSQSLDVSAHQCPERIPYQQAVQREFQPVQLGWRWGPAWSTVWFHITGSIPEKMAGSTVALRFSTATEALLWQDGIPLHGLDDNHKMAILLNQAQGGEKIDLYVEAACNHPFGATTFWWNPPDLQQRWQQPEPGLLELCEIAVYHPTIWQLWQSFDFARQLLLQLPEDSQRARRLCEGLRQTLISIDERDVTGTADAALKILRDALRGNAPASQTACRAVGHAHIDTAWLWPLGETRRKCMRTFASVLSLQERFPDFYFMHSQAQHYAWIERESPELFAKISNRIRDGRWEAGGAMWVEPDCNVPSGESLIRQIIHGTRYWNEKFGVHASQRHLFLPDTFGFPTILPQIMKLAGLDTFLTNKLWWSDANEFPHVNFIWRGLDGSEIVSHLMPGRDYNSAMTPAELLRGEKTSARLDRSNAGLWLQPFGFGDGGGGPTDATILATQLAGECEGLPAVKPSRVTDFCDELHEIQQQADRPWPVWDGELYLEYHRGTLTTAAWLKQANRRAEQGLRTAEWLNCAGPTPPNAEAVGALRERLDGAWKTLLLNQFHDILPGSSITKVYEEARVQMDQFRSEYEQIIDAGLQNWAAQIDTRGIEQPVAVFNPSSFTQSGVIECDGQPCYVEDVPPLGVTVVDRTKTATIEPATVSGHVLSNGIISATIDDTGRIAKLIHLASGRDACHAPTSGKAEPLNQLVLYDDQPRAWEAWDIDAEYEDKGFAVDGSADKIEIVEDGLLRVAIEVTRPLGQSSQLTQCYALEAGSPRLDIQTHVEWHESRRMLRALFPVDVHTQLATYDVSFGHLQRPTHRNTPWDRARFEACAHRWMDLSEPGFGVAVLNDCKYGHSCNGRVMGLTLLRSPKFPDQNADMGPHSFTYAVMPHAGDWRDAGVDLQAQVLNQPLLSRPLSADQSGSIKGAWAPVTIAIDGLGQVEIVAFKPAEDGKGAILRLVETHGGRARLELNWNIQTATVQTVDLLERSMELEGFKHNQAAGRTTLGIRPFQIVTLAVNY